jgi:SPP1 gp7 family putative phage head morphogenesis protein
MQREAEALKKVVAAYLQASAEMQKRIARLLDVGITETNRAEFTRLLSLQQQIQAELAKFNAVAGQAIATAKGEAITLAQEQAAEILGSFNRLPKGAIENLIGAFEPNSPLANFFKALGDELTFTARGILVSGVAQGLSTQAIARQIRDEFGMGLHQATVISRTEVLRAYRNSSSEIYKANRDAVKGWIWFAALGSRCCAMCTAQHGTEHPVDEEFVSHPMCRCVAIPITEPNQSIQTGVEWLSKQDEETQVAVLGIAGRKAWQSGAVKLSDFVGEGFHPQFGAIRYQKSLKQILGTTGATQFYKRAA